MTNRDPWFRFFPADFMGSESVVSMNAEERGVYVCALLLDWCNEDGVPDDAVMLARLARLLPEEVARAWPVVRKCFSDRGDGRLTNDRLKLEREYIDKRREEGRRGAEKRWGKNEETDPSDTTDKPNESLPNGDPMATHSHPNGIQNRAEQRTEIDIRNSNGIVPVVSKNSPGDTRDQLFDDIRKAFPDVREPFVEELFREHGRESIAKQLQYFPKRKDGARKPWALFRASIEGDWDAPVIFSHPTR